MPIQYTYETSSEILVVKIQGLITLDEMQKAMLDILSTPSIPETTNALWDVNEMKFSNITLELQQQIIDLRRQIDARRGHAKIAIYSSYTLLNRW